MTPDTAAVHDDAGASPALDEPFELPDELRIDTAVARRIMVEFIRAQLRQAGFERALLGLSGGIDSALVAYLVAEAIGPERLLCLMLPYRTSSPASRGDAEEVVRRLGCAAEAHDISPMVDAWFGAPGGRDATALRRGNLMARTRMMVLYDRSVTWRGLVVGTGNKTETLIGYTTLFGDGASAFNPIGDLYKSQVRQVAAAVGVPDAIIRKAPSADLWPGQTDEGEVGFSYALVDRILFRLVDRRQSIDDVVEEGFERGTVERLDRLVAGAEFKRQIPPVAKLGPRTAGVDYLYPPPPTTFVGRLTSVPGTPTRGTLRVVATPIGNMGDITLRAIDVLRASAVVAAEDTRLTRRLWARHGIATPLVSYHARSAPAREAALLDRLEAGDDVALVTDAGTPLVSDPGSELVRAWLDRGGRVEPIPGPSAVLAALVASGLPAARWVFEGFLPRRGADRGRRLARIAAEDRTTVLFEAPGRTAATLRELAGACGAERGAALCRELTKLHEEVRRGRLAELAAEAAATPPRGEVTLVVAGAPADAAAPRVASAAAARQPGGEIDVARARALVQALVAAGQPRAAAARQVARETGLARRELFISKPEEEGT